MRLYIICIIWVSGYIPVECYVLYSNLATFDLKPFSWSTVHDPENWKKIVMVPSGGKIMYDRWIWLSCGFLVFVFFGFGKDAVNMYRTGLLAIGMGKIFPALRHDYRGSIAATISSYGSRARMIFKGKRSGSNSTWASTSKESYATTSTDPVSPKKETCPPTIDESASTRGREAMPTHILDGSSRPISNRVYSAFRSKKSTPLPNTDLLQLAGFAGQQATVQSTVTSGPQPPTLTDHTRSISSDEMLMRTEVRQGSEHELPQVANTIPKP
jgi:pheromone a factor receptor